MAVLLFDMDGTLLNSMPAWIRCEDHLIDQYQLLEKGVHNRETISQMGLWNLCEFISNLHDGAHSPDKIYSEILDHMEGFYCSEVEVIAGVRPFLEAMQAYGITMSVATATDHDLASKALNHANLLPFFDEVFTNDRSLSHKGESAYWDHIAEHYQLPKSDFILFDDAAYALRGAKHSGLRTVGLRDLKSEEEAMVSRQFSDAFYQSIADIDPGHFIEHWLKRT
ncbi:MAG: HAD family phosphatase [Eubacteriales bacterium]|nr:HAD family phosphatase [Eubacteriales bacterium]